MKNAINSKKELNDTQNAVASLLEQLGVTFNVVYCGDTVRDGNWQCDAWRVNFSKGKENQFFDYFTGTGRRELPRGYKSYGKTTPFEKRQQEAAKLPVFPVACDVLYSLVSDSPALDTSFDNWASDYGYDTDSIKAFNTYQVCCEEAKKLYKVFSREEVKQLQELLQDY